MSLTLLYRIFIGRYDEDSKNNWLFMKNFTDRPAEDIYVTSIYFTVTTVLTVGYGDISPFNNIEKFFCIILMVFGVISFSYSTGALSTII